MNMRTGWVRYAISLIGVVVILFGISSKHRAEDAGRQVGTAETLTAISPTEYEYAIEARNMASRSVSILVRPYAKADVAVTVTAWRTSEGLNQPTVLPNVQSGIPSIRVEMGPQQSGTLTLRLKTASPMAAPRLNTLPLRAAGLPIKAWEFYLDDLGD